MTSIYCNIINEIIIKIFIYIVEKNFKNKNEIIKFSFEINTRINYFIIFNKFNLWIWTFQYLLYKIILLYVISLNKYYINIGLLTINTF